MLMWLQRRSINVGRKAVLVALFAASCLVASTAQAAKDERLDRMPEKYRDWVEKEVTYIITPRERDAFLNLESVQDWEAFMQAFWRRRDPDSLTPVNEFKEEHYRRLEYANTYLGRESAVPGWMTDRGKMAIILGEPDDKETFMSVGWLYPTEVWFYQANKDKSLPPLYLLFFRDNNAGAYRLFNHLLDQPEDLMPAQPLDTDNSRRDAYDLLQRISPELAHASITMRADQGPFAGLHQSDVSSLDFQLLLSDIYESPFKKVDISYLDAADGARGLVESEYLFNYVPNFGMANVIHGPGGTSFVHYSVEIEPQHMTLARDPDAGVYYTRFELRGQITTLDDEDKAIYQFTKEPFIRLTESQFQGVYSRPFSYRDMFPLAEGDFRFRVVLKNQARSEYTIFETELHVPVRNDELFLGSPILLYGTGEMTDAEATHAYRTYQLGSLRLEPNAKRAYVIGEALTAFVPIENASPEHQLRLRLVSEEDPPRTVTEKQSPLAQYEGKPIVERLPLVEITGGHYRLVADLLDPSGATLETTTADVDITPRTEIPRPWVMRESINGEDVGLVKTALAEQYLQLGESATARAMYQEALDANPNLATPRVVLARYQLDEKRPVEAIKLLEPAYAQNKENVPVLLTLGDAHFEVKNYQRAAELYEAAVILRPPDTSLFNALAVSHAQQGHSEKALHYLERSLELDPNQEEIKTLLAQLKNPSTPQK